MMKILARTPEGPVAVFGLSRENVDQLIAGNDIHFDGKPFGLNGTVVITFGEVESALAARFGLPPVEPTPDTSYMFDPVLGMRAQKTGPRG